MRSENVHREPSILISFLSAETMSLVEIASKLSGSKFYNAIS